MCLELVLRSVPCRNPPPHADPGSEPPDESPLPQGAAAAVPGCCSLATQGSLGDPLCGGRLGWTRGQGTGR